MFLVDLDGTQVLVRASSVVEALRTAWLEAIRSNCEDGEYSVEKFREELGEVPREQKEDFLRTYKRSLRNFGYLWAEFKLKDIKALTEQEWDQLSQIYKEATW